MERSRRTLKWKGQGEGIGPGEQIRERLEEGDRKEEGGGRERKQPGIPRREKGGVVSDNDTKQ